jgi:hypothetical protein
MNDLLGEAGVAFGVTGFARELDADPPKLRRKGCIQDRLWMDALHMVSLLVDGLAACTVAQDYFCSAAVAAAAGFFAAGFFRLLMMIVISGTISKGRIPFSGW